jgi:hypothetical protein
MVTNIFSEIPAFLTSCPKLKINPVDSIAATVINIPKKNKTEGISIFPKARIVGPECPFDSSGLELGSIVKERLLKNSAIIAGKFSGNEQRRASHILIGFGVSATEAQKAQAKAKAQEILAAIKKDPKSFESLAIKHSQDRGSAV